MTMCAWIMHQYTVSALHPLPCEFVWQVLLLSADMLNVATAVVRYGHLGNAVQDGRHGPLATS